MTKPDIAFLGIGIMGYQQARRLLEAGYRVTGWNRTRAKAERLQAHGGAVADRPAEAAKGVDIVIAMLADGATSDAVLFDEGVAGAMKRGATILNMASIPVETAKEEARRAAEMGLRFIDAPVSGGEKGATEGTLAIMAGGEPAVFEEVRPVLEVMGRPKLVGPAGTGSLAKLCNQLIVGNTITTVAEAMLLAKRGGADPAAVRAALAGGFADSPILRLHGERMIEGNFTPGGRSTLQLKDLRTARALARALSLDLPVLEQVTELYADFVDQHGGAEKDHAGIYVELARRNGIES
jgi:3-hydroxyisobutyrate dehydrogenase-like beta-hydroxyacid dehydrogenase